MRKDLVIVSLLYFTTPFASAIKLSNFQDLTVDVTEACENAYDEKIPGCRAIDFDQDGTCSSGCIAGLNQIASGVLESCGGVVVSSSTLLGKIFNGEIIPSLCPNNGDSSSAAPKQSSTPAPATTAQPTSQPAPKSSKVASTAPASSASAGSPSSSAAPKSESSAAPSGSSSVLSASSAPSSTSSSDAAQTSPSQAQTKPNEGKSGLTVQQQQIAAMSHSGGGSPFDIVGYSAAGRLSSRDTTAVVLGLALLTIGWLLR